jgi:SAM-dependent methyltransferase
MFTKSARFYDSLYGFKNYAAASARLAEMIRARVPGARSLLDVGCGTGRHVELLASEFEVAGADLSPELLAVARERCPGVPFHEADMADFDLGRRFDVVTCLFSAIAYVKTEARMRQAVASFARHLEPGGLVVIEPWFPPERYWTGTITANFVNEPDLKVAWMYTSEREQDVSVLDIHYMVGTPDGVHEFTELHELGLFTHEAHVDALRAAGLRDIEHDPRGLFDRGLYLARSAGA